MLFKGGGLSLEICCSFEYGCTLTAIITDVIIMTKDLGRVGNRIYSD